MNRGLRIGVTLVGLVGITVCCTACSSTGAAPEAPSETTTSGPTPAPMLPDAVPLPPGTELASPAEPIPGGQRFSGWTAVAVTTDAADAQAVAGGLVRDLSAARWTVRTSGSGDEGVLISATQSDGNQNRWLNISITPPLPGEGRAVTYRYAAGPDPIEPGRTT